MYLSSCPLVFRKFVKVNLEPAVGPLYVYMDLCDAETFWKFLVVLLWTCSAMKTRPFDNLVCSRLMR